MRYRLAITMAVVLLATAAPVLGRDDERVNLLAYNAGPSGPVYLWYENEGFFVRFDPQSESQITILSASVWVCAQGDPGWPSPDNYHQSFSMVINHADGEVLGEELYREPVLYMEAGAATHWVTINPRLNTLGPFFVGAIQVNDHPYVEALMHDGNVDYPDMHWTNAAHGWGRCVDRIPNFPGDLLAWCMIERENGVQDDESGSTPRTIIIGNPHPNPFNASTSLEFVAGRGGMLSVELSTIAGIEVNSFTLPITSSGRHHIDIDLKNHPAGVYLARFHAGEAPVVRKLVLVR